MDVQADSVHFPDRIFQRDGINYLPADEKEALIVKCANSREFLQTLGIQGEIISTPSHSKDSVSVILDSGDCFVGDLQRREYDPDEDDWKRVMSFRPKRIYYAHGPMAELMK